MDALTALIGRTPLPDHIVLEASGVALPGTLAASLTLRPEVRLEGVVVLLDASAVLAQVADRWLGDTVERQVREAQLIVLNQADRASEPESVAVRTWLSKEVPGVPVIEAVRGEVPADVLLGPRSAAGPVWFGGPPIAGFEALTLRLKADISVAQINAALMDAGVSLLRVKAIVAEKDGGGWLIQSVGPRIEIGRVLGAPPRSHLTAIARRGHGFETIKPLGTVIDGTD
jgi:G3E family GTPase